MKSRISNAYVKIFLYMLAGAAVGAVAGAGIYMLLDGRGQELEGAAVQAFGALQGAILPLLSALLVLSVLAGELTCRKLKAAAIRLPEADDEESDRLEYEEEKWGALSLNLNIVSQVLNIIILAAGYSSNYLGNSDTARSSFLYACVVFVICMAYDGIWQIRYVKLVQLGHPEKTADPSDRNFQKAWLESCDEAEREVIYRSSYKAYLAMGKLVPALLIVTMLGNLFFNTGMLAVVIVAVIWLAVTLTYTRSCVALKGEKALLK